MEAANSDRGLRWYAAREPIVLGVLTLLAFAGFAAVGALSNLFHRDQQERGSRWYNRGIADVQAQQLTRAIADFRTALLFSRDNYLYQLGLAQALAAQSQGGQQEAKVYLMDLWERQPENGTVNLALARIAAQRGDKDEALRYYHNAIYALWNQNPDAQRRAARFELTEFLLRENATTEAQAELIALSTDLPENPAIHVHVADLFMQTQDYEHALQEYRQALKLDHQDPAALAGIGRASFQLGNYSTSQRYLKQAVAAGADSGSGELLDSVNLVLKMDPFQRRLPSSQRTQIAVQAFNTAGQRLQECIAQQPAPATGSAPSDEQGLQTRWSAMKPKITEAALRRDPDAIEAAMDLVFESSKGKRRRGVWSAYWPELLALFLISKLHEGN